MLSGASAVVIVTPSAVIRQTCANIAPFVNGDTPIVVCCKGVEEGSGLVPVEVLEAELGNASRLAALAGPNHAEEVILGIPAGTVIASQSEQTARFFQGLFATEAFRTYISEDVIGVEVCAAAKNVIAIACGLSYGMGYGVAFDDAWSGGNEPLGRRVRRYAHDVLGPGGCRRPHCYVHERAFT